MQSHVNTRSWRRSARLVLAASHLLLIFFALLLVTRHLVVLEANLKTEEIAQAIEEARNIELEWLQPFEDRSRPGAAEFSARRRIENASRPPPQLP